MVVRVELTMLGIEIIRDAARTAQLIRSQRQKALVRMQVLALVPVDVVEPDGEAKDND